MPLDEIQDKADQENDPDVTIDIRVDDGRVVGTITVPPGLVESDPDEAIVLQAGTVFIDMANRILDDNQMLGSVITDITLESSTQGRIRKLAQKLTICLEDVEEDQEKCLGYYNEKKERWECEDRCLKKKGNNYCGETDHLTSFALLLGGGNQNCGNPFDGTLAWISLGFVSGAVLIIILFAAINEFRIQYHKRNQAKFLHHLEVRPRSTFSP